MDEPNFIDKEREIFLQAVKLAPDQQAGFLDTACGEDAALRSAVEALLAHDVDDSFLAEPAVEAPAASRLEAPGSWIGRYQIIKEIGRGGMGVVFRARQVEPVRREVAVKVIKAGMDTAEVVARFQAERQALALMEHPHIAMILDAGATESGRPFVVMELVEGMPISEFCQSHQLNTRERLQLFTKVCGAVQHAHQKGVIHRDLKPSNVLVKMHEGSAFPKVIDFGIAKAAEGNVLTDQTRLTQHHPFLGTPAYISPEQAQTGASNVDTRTDIYALGVLLYELLTGTPPFDPERLRQEGHEAMFRIIREEAPSRPSIRITERRRQPGHETNQFAIPLIDLSRELDWIVLKALEKERERRYDTANGLALDVERFLNDEPVSAVAPSRWYALRKLVRRNRAVSLASAVAVLAMVIGLGLTLHANTREREARQLAEDRRYASDMKVALEASKRQQDVLKALVKEHLPKDGAPDRRGWLWRYLLGQSRQERNSITPGNVGALAISHDGRWIAHGRHTEAGEQVIELRDAGDFKLAKTLSHPGGYPNTIAFTPDDTELMAAPTRKSAAIRYDLKTGAAAEISTSVMGLLPRHCQLGETGYLLWLNRLPEDGPQRYQVECRPALDTLAAPVISESFDLPVIGGTENEFHVSPDGTRAALACIDPETNVPIVRILRVPQLEEVGSLSVDGVVSALAWSPDSQFLALGYYYPNRVEVWQLANVREPSLLVSLPEGRSPRTDLCFSNDGTLLGSSEMSGLIHLWELPEGKLRRTYSTADHQVMDTGFSADGTTFYTSAWDSVIAWDAHDQSASDLKRLSAELDLWNLTYSPDGALIATSAADGMVRLFDAETEALVDTLGKPRRSARAPDVGNADARVRFSPDGRQVAAVNHTSVSLYTLETGFGIELDNRASVDDLSFSPDSRLLASAGKSPEILLWDTRTGEESLRIRDAHGAFVMGVAFSPKEEFELAYTTRRNQDNVVLVSLADIQRRRSATCPGEGYGLTFSPDGKLLVCGMRHRAGIFTVEPNFALERVIEGAWGPVAHVSFSPDGTTLAIPCWGGFVQLWNRKVQAEVGRLNPSPREGQWLISAEFSPNRNDIAVSVRDYGIHIYRAPSLE